MVPAVRPAFKPALDQNRMKHAGDVRRARERYFERPSENLRLVVEERYRWMNDFIPEGGTGVELGAGSGLSKGFIHKGKLLVTDYEGHDWLDVKHVDALKTPFEDASFDFVIEVNIIHHLAHPLRFFEEVRRILKPGGRLIAHDVHGSLFMRTVLRLQRHEGYDFNVDVFDPVVPCNDPNDPWSANNAVVDLLFEDEARFAQHVPYFRLIHRRYTEFLTLLNSGGVIAQAPHVPLPRGVVETIARVDRALIDRFPDLFASHVQFVLEKTG